MASRYTYTEEEIWMFQVADQIYADIYAEAAKRQKRGENTKNPMRWTCSSALGQHTGQGNPLDVGDNEKSFGGPEICEDNSSANRVRNLTPVVSEAGPYVKAISDRATALAKVDELRDELASSKVVIQNLSARLEKVTKECDAAQSRKHIGQ